MVTFASDERNLMFDDWILFESRKRMTLHLSLGNSADTSFPASFSIVYFSPITVE